MKFPSKTRFALLALVLAALAPRRAAAQVLTPTWLGGSGSWDTGANWSSGSPPPNNYNGSTAGNFISGSGVVTMGNGDNFGSLIFDGNVGSYTFTGGTMTLQTNIVLGSSSNSITGSNITETIDSPIVSLSSVNTFANNTTDPTDTLYIAGSFSSPGYGFFFLNGANSGSNTIAGTISGGFYSFTKSGTGRWILTGSNNFTASNTNINGGILQIGAGGTTGNLSNGVIADNAELLYDRSDTVTLANSISGSGSIVQGGAGTLIFTNNTTYSGGTIINSGTVQVGNGNTLGSLGTGGIVNNSALVYDLNGSLTDANNISGAGTITQSGPGVLTLAGTSTFTGPLTVNAGTLFVNSLNNSGTAGNLGAAGSGAGNLVFGSGTLEFSAGSTDRLFTMGDSSGTDATLVTAGSGSFTNTGAIAFGNASVHNLTLSGDYGGTGLFAPSIGDQSPGNPTNVTITGGGIWTLTGTNSYTGLTSVGYGELDLNTTGGQSVGGNILIVGGSLVLLQSNQIAASGSLSIGYGTLYLGGNNQTLADVQLASQYNASNIAGTGGTLTVTGTLDFQTGSVGANLAGTAGLGKTTSGTVMLAGTNTFTGLTTVSAGELDLNTTGGQSIATRLLVNGGYAKLLQANQVAASGSVSVGSGTFDIGANNQALARLQITGGVIAGTGGTLSSSGSYDIESGTVSAILGGTSGLAKTTGGTAVISGSNSYTGATNINAGVLNLGGGGALGGGGITFGGGVLQYSGSNTGDYSAFIASSTAAMMIDTNGRNVTYSSALASSNTGGLTKLGSGTLVLAGNNSYTGVTSINAGVLNLGGGGALGGGGNITFNGGTLQYSGSNTGDYSGVISSSTGAIMIDTNAQNVTYSSALAASNVGGLTKLGSGTLTLAAVNNYGGLTTVIAGELDLNATGGPAFAGNLAVNGGIAGLLQANEVGGSGSISISSGTLNIGANNQAVGNVQITGGVIAGSGGTLTSSNAYDIESGTVSANLGGASGLVKSTSGTATLSGANSYTGVTNINAGVLNLGGSGALGGGGNITFNGGTLQYSGSNTNDYSGVIASSTAAMMIDTNGRNVTYSSALAASNTGGLTKLGSGTLVLAGNNNYTGTTGINAGVLNLGGSGALGGGGNITFNGGVLQYSGSNTGDYSGVIASSTAAIAIDTNGQAVIYSSALAGSNTGGLTKLGSGTLVLAAANSYSGLTTASAGELDLDSAGGVAVPGSITASGGYIKLLLANQAATSGSLAVVGGGTFDLGAYNQSVSYVSLNGGVIAGSGGTLSSSSFYSFVSGTAGANLAGAASLVKSGAAANVVLTGSNSYSGATSVSSGTLTLAGGSINTPGADTSVTNANTNFAITSGGVAMDRNGFVYSGGAAAVSSGSWINSGSLVIAQSGAGVVYLSGSGVIAVGSGTGNVTLAVAAGSSGTFNFSGGTLNAGVITGGAGNAVLDFTGSGSTTFSTAITGSVAVMRAGAGGMTTLTAAGSAHGTTVDSGTLAAASGAVLNNGTWSAIVGNVFGDNGTVVINGGSMSSGTTTIGNGIGSNGTVIVNSGTFANGSTTFTTSGTGQFTIGNSGTGSLVINGGLVQPGGYGANGPQVILGGSATGNGSLTINSGSFYGNVLSDVQVGGNGNGSLTMTGGYYTSYATRFGYSAGSSGTGQISGGTLSDTYFVAGMNGTGSVLVNGGLVNGPYGVIADYAGSNGTVTVSSGSFLFTGSLNVGNRSTGVLNVQGGVAGTGFSGSSTSGAVIIGNTDPTGLAAPSNGTVTVSGGTFTSGTITIGTTSGSTSGTGAMNINGGYVSDISGVLNTGTASFQTGGAATVTVTSGSWLNSGSLIVGGTFSSGGTLNINGGYVSASSVGIGNMLFGSNSSAVNVTGGTWNVASSLYVGISNPASLNLSGSGVVNINGGAGTLTLAKAGGSGTLNDSGGMLNAAVVATNGLGVVNFTNTGSNTFAPRITGNILVNQTGTGTTVLTGSSSYTGATNITHGTLIVNGTTSATGAVGISPAGALGGTGKVGNLSGGGKVAPGGNSILTASQADPTSGMSYAFHMSGTGAPNYGSSTASGNDVLHLTGATPLTAALTSANTIAVDFTGLVLQSGQIYYGGLFTDAAIANAMVQNATFAYTGLGGATVQFAGMTTVASAAFTTGTVSNGEVMEFDVTGAPVPAAPPWALAFCAAGMAMVASRRLARGV